VRVKVLHKVFAAVNVALGILHIIFGFTEPVAKGSPHLAEGTFFLGISVLFFGAATGFMLGSRWAVVLTSAPLALLSLMFAFLIAGGGWIWGPSYTVQMYVFILASLLIAAIEIAGIISIIKSKRAPAAGTDPANS
jgi:hypothetical protein